MFDKAESCSTMRIMSIKVIQRLLFPPCCSACHLVSLLLLDTLGYLAGKRKGECLAVVLTVFYASLFKLTGATKSKCKCSVKYLRQLIHLHRRVHIRVIHVRFFVSTLFRITSRRRSANSCVK